MKHLLLLIAVLFLSVNAFATHVAVLETMADGEAQNTVSLTDRQYLTNVLREQAVLELTAEENYTIMTRENISAMLPPGKAIEDCEGSCLAETGRNISADYVCQARIGNFDGKLTLSAELYETAGNKLVTSFNGLGTNMSELLELIKEKSPKFFHRVKELDKPEAVVAAEIPAEESPAEGDRVIPSAAEESLPDSVRAEAAVAYDEFDDKDASRVGESIPADVNDEPAKEGKYRWIPLSFGAVAVVTGVVLAVVGNSNAKDAAEKGFDSQSEYKDNRGKAENGQMLRGTGIGLAIIGAICIGVSFVF